MQRLASELEEPELEDVTIRVRKVAIRRMKCPQNFAEQANNDNRGNSVTPTPGTRSEQPSQGFSGVRRRLSSTSAVTVSTEEEQPRAADNTPNALDNPEDQKGIYS